MRDLHELPKIRDSMSFLYLEHGRLEQDALSVKFIDETGAVTQAPAASLTCLMLGPGTTITHAAVKALADNGCSVLWVGEEGVRLYASGVGETRKGYRLIEQARQVSDSQRHMAVVRRMYEYRFSDPLDAGLTIEQVRGFEGVRVREGYAAMSRKYGVEWTGRRYDKGNWAAADPVNRALSAANACLNGVCHAAILAIGFSPGLGFIHTGRQLSFVYDIADLYKMETTVPAAFEMTADTTLDLERRVRRRCRELFRETRLLQRILPDMDRLLDITAEQESVWDQLDLTQDTPERTPLWTPESGETQEIGDGGDGP